MGGWNLKPVHRCIVEPTVTTIDVTPLDRILNSNEYTGCIHQSTETVDYGLGRACFKENSSLHISSANLQLTF